MAYIAERWDSRNGSDSADSASEDLVYVVADAETEAEAVALVAIDAPQGISSAAGRPLVKQSMDWETQEGDIVHVTVHYGLRKPREPGEFDFTFDTVGGNEKITQSKKTKNKYAIAGETAADYQGAIGVNEDTVEGVDLPTSTFKWTETHLIPLAACSFAYGDLLENLTGKRNAATFRGKPVGAVIFRGAQGGKKDEENAQVTFHFESGKHVTDLKVGTITGIKKDAWDYLWCRYRTSEDATAKQLVKRPVSVYIEEVTEEGDFSQLGIGTDVPPPP